MKLSEPLNWTVRAGREFNPAVGFAIFAIACLVLVGWVRLSSPTSAPSVITPSAMRVLNFIDQPDGSIRVIDHETHDIVDNFSGEQGFLRGPLRALVREAVVSELVKRGYAEGGDTPDFRVGFHVTIKDLPSKDLCTVRTHVFGAYTHRDVEVCRVHDAAGSREYRKGTLVVFVIDRETGVLLWQGVAEGTAGSPAEARSRVKAAIGRMFLDFPARGTEG